MMSETQLGFIVDGWQVPPQEESANAEIDQVLLEYKVANALNEVAYYRIWRLRNTGNWRNIVDADVSQKYSTWEELIIDMSHQLHCGRQILYDRVRAYEQLSWTGYTPEESIRMMSDYPALYGRALNKLMEWNQRTGEPILVHTPDNRKMTEKQAKEYVKGILGDINNFESQKEALQYISSDILLEPQANFWYDGDKIYFVYYEQKIGEDGWAQVHNYQRAEFYPDVTLTVDAKKALQKLFEKTGHWRAEEDAKPLAYQV